MRILLVCERLWGAEDEGIKNLGFALLRELSRRHLVLALTDGRPGHPRVGVQVVRMNRFFLNWRLLAASRRFLPDSVLYIPWTSGTPRAFWRGRILRLATRAPVALFLTQPYDAVGWERAIIRGLLPDLAMAQSEPVRAQLQGWGVDSVFIPSGVDLARFRILPRARREAERESLGVHPGQQLVVHVGHLNRRRLDASEIGRLALDPGRKLLVVGSTNTPQDSTLARDLGEHGVMLIREFVPSIERILAAADVYLFPVREVRSSIGVPLSVLEALACGVPVVSTPFGGLPRLFPDSPWLRFASSPSEVEQALRSSPPAPSGQARALVAGLGWERVAATVAGVLARARERAVGRS